MELDPELIKKLLPTFSAELDERCQIITDGLLKLEKNEDVTETIEAIFRSAHNIKGAARSIGVKDVGDIAHKIENIFTSIQTQAAKINPELINLCLEAVDKMRVCLQTFTDKTSPPFDVTRFLERLKWDETSEIKHDLSLKKVNVTDKRIIKPAATETESIRVSIENLNHVSALTEEIQVIKIAIDEHYNELTKLSLEAKRIEKLWKETGFAIYQLTDKNVESPFQQLYNDSVNGFNHLNHSLQQLHKNMHRHINDLTFLSNSLMDEVRMLRLIPASTLFHTFPRIVRDISQELNKQVALKITGDSVKMDKMVLEGLQDPIIHLLRNAIDHGIESTEQRAFQRKDPIGKISIDISEQGDQILITITDDGAGIDINKIALTAIKNHFILPAERDNLSENEILNLIFLPGFSTKEIITDVSGRGVGLDVVKSNIDHLKGQVNIKTIPGKETTFYLRVPLTLASERGLLIRSGGQLFVIPTNWVERVLTLRPQEIIDIEASQAILLDQHPIALHSLADILDLEHKEAILHDQLPIIILKKGSLTIALLVEDIINEREIVIKPLLAPLINVPCIAGGTLAGNGEVIIVLNTNDLMNRSLRAEQVDPILLKPTTETKRITRPHILVVDDSITTRTLEKNILESKDYQVTVAVDGKEAWDLLQKQTFNLLITDITMPIMDGFTLTRHVKQSHQLQDLPVIIVTSLGSDAEKKKGIDVGADAYIVKNEFESEKLLAIVSQFI